MKVVGIDVGVTWGIALNNKECEEHTSKTILDFYEKVRDFIDIYKPDVVATAYPTARTSVIASQNRKLGIVELLCQKRGIAIWMTNDAHAQKVVLGHKRKAQNKRTDEDWQELTKRYNVESEHIADALMFKECYEIENK